MSMAHHQLLCTAPSAWLFQCGRFSSLDKKSLKLLKFFGTRCSASSCDSAPQALGHVWNVSHIALLVFWPISRVQPAHLGDCCLHLAKGLQGCLYQRGAARLRKGFKYRFASRLAKPHKSAPHKVRTIGLSDKQMPLAHISWQRSFGSGDSLHGVFQGTRQPL